MKDKELWKDIQGYEDLYQISSLGRVKRLERENKSGNNTRVLKEMIMTPVKNRHGYMGLNITIDKKNETPFDSPVSCYSFYTKY